MANVTASNPAARGASFGQRLSRRVQEEARRASGKLESLAYSLTHRKPTALEAGIIADLRVEGVHVGSVGEFFPASDDPVHQALAKAGALLREGPPPALADCFRNAGTSTDMLAGPMLDQFPQLYLLGLSDPIVSLAEQFFQAPVAYHGAVIRHSRVDGDIAGPRYWHRDGEDRHVLRIVVYLNDVTPGGGPFEYISRRSGVGPKDMPTNRGQYSNQEMEAVVPREQWKQIYAPAGSIVFCDTATTYHHESVQTERSRSVIMMGFSTRKPTNLGSSMGHFAVEPNEARLREVVPAHLQPLVFDWRKPA